jgi:hypothetical protein
MDKDKGLIENEIRNKSGSYKFLVRQIDKEIDKTISELYDKFKGKVSYDGLHTLIMDSSYIQKNYRIALEAEM